MTVDAATHRSLQVAKELTLWTWNEMSVKTMLLVLGSSKAADSSGSGWVIVLAA
jgi:hypothetical protein